MSFRGKYWTVVAVVYTVTCMLILQAISYFTH